MQQQQGQRAGPGGGSGRLASAVQLLQPDCGSSGENSSPCVSAGVIVQASLASPSAAFVIDSVSNVAALSDQAQGLPCDAHLNATWLACSATVASGQGCTCIDVPCAVGVAEFAATAPDVACAASTAALPPLDVPLEAGVTLRLVYDDGLTRPVSYPPANGANVTFSVIAGDNACEVVYAPDGRPTVQAVPGTCTTAICTVRMQHAAPCSSAVLTADARVGVVDLQCLQMGFQCQDADAPPTALPTAGDGCAPPPRPELRQLSCSSQDFQQRTVWVSALITPGRDTPTGELPAALSGIACAFRARVPHASRSALRCPLSDRIGRRAGPGRDNIRRALEQ